MSVRAGLDREFDGLLLAEEKRKKSAERQQVRRDKLKAEGKIRFSADINLISNERFKWVLDLKGNVTKAEFIERLIQREFNANSRALYEKRNKALNEFGYNNLPENSGLNQKLLDELNKLEIKKIKKSNRKHKASFHPTAQPNTSRIKSENQEIDKSKKKLKLKKRPRNENSEISIYEEFDNFKY